MFGIQPHQEQQSSSMVGTDGPDHRFSMRALSMRQLRYRQKILNLINPLIKQLVLIKRTGALNNLKLQLIIILIRRFSFKVQRWRKFFWFRS